MSSYSYVCLDHHLHHELTQPSDQLQLSRQAARRYAVMQALRDQRAGRQTVRTSRPVRAYVRRFLPARA